MVLNGYPGVGKLTIGRELAKMLGGKLLDIHSVYNVAFALTEFKSQEFIDTVEKIEAIAHDLIHKLPSKQPVILTTVLARESDWGDDEWRRIVKLGMARPPFCIVHVSCNLEENKRRIRSEERTLMLKLRDPETAIRNQSEGKKLYGQKEPNLLHIDTSDMEPIEAAKSVSNWIQSL